MAARGSPACDPIATIAATPRNLVFRHRSPQHWLEIFRTYYGPAPEAFAALAPVAQSALEDDLLALVARVYRSGDGTVVVPSEYLEIVATRR